MQTHHHVDVAILGAGTAGLGARRAALNEGCTVLVIDPGPLGTTCARDGCMPSKLLIAAADAAHHARTADVFGVHAEPTVHGKAVLARVQAERDRFVGFVLDAIDDLRDRGELLEERATVVAPGVLQAGEHKVHYERLVLATGAAPFVPPPYRELSTEVTLTNESVFDLSDLPDSVLVVGVGILGLELGQALHRLGVQTTLLGIGGHVGPLTDPDVLASAVEHLGSELDLHVHHQLHSVEEVDGGVRVRFTGVEGGEHDRVFQRVLLSAGRQSTLGSLGLEALGVEADDDGHYPVDPATLQLGRQPVFVAGDANEIRPMLHEAVDEGRTAGRNAARHPELTAPRRRTPLSIVFTDPQIGMVGSTYCELEGHDVSTGEVSYGDQGRARVQHTHRGLVRIYADKHTHRLLGAELFGPRVEHLSHLLAWAVQAGLTVEQAVDMPFYHPVVEEGLRTALRDIATKLGARRPVDCTVAEEGVGS